ncbi:glycosyltransferase [Pedobacter chinensis]|uniref:Glycosyltransferase n=1 Tax=Pedobacter chinensis TaxID=2282421 RepID=A0A369PW29_9SPHI|nr:glycosyltransferase [Pedobacter chinensis]
MFSGSIVLYNNEATSLKKAIDSFLKANNKGVLYLIDNSTSDVLKKLANMERIHYIHNPSNPGFGAAHNVALNLAIEAGYQYHFIINPDIYFNVDIITPMLNYMQDRPDVGMLMPEVLNEDGSVQYLPKLLPSPFWIFRRKLKKPAKIHQKFVDKYELQKVGRRTIYNSPLLSGCFTLLNLTAIKELGGYDDQYFMYFEDFDLSRRIHRKYKTIYFPNVSVYHSYDSGANKSSRLFSIFVSSAITYFNKWGWFFDKERIKVNKETLKQFES